MGLLTRSLLAGTLVMSTMAGCGLHDTLAPAMPQRFMPWDNSRPFIPQVPPPEDLAYKPPVITRTVFMPPAEEMTDWKPLLLPTERCVIRKKKRVCTMRNPVVEQGQTMALVRPTTRDMVGSTVQYKVDPGKVYLIEVAAHAATHLLFPQGEVFRVPPVLSKELFVTGGDPTPEEDILQDLLVVRAKGFPQRPITLPLLFKSGLIIHIRLQTIDGDPMTTVHFDAPPRKPMVAQHLQVPVSERPPKFRAEHMYTGYTMKPTGKEKLTPPWLPLAVADDGQNTIVRFDSALYWTRSPVVMGVQPNGKLALVTSRLWHHPRAPEQGALLLVQGLWPALDLSDGVLSLRITREVPPGAGALRPAGLMPAAAGGPHAQRY